MSKSGSREAATGKERFRVSKDKELGKMVNDQEEEMEVGNIILKDASKKAKANNY